jgi:hypothetical protein
MGLLTPEYDVVVGVSTLRGYIKHYGDVFIKTSSTMRGTMETWHSISPEHSRVQLNALETKLGALSEHVRFVVERPIETELETGIDTYTVDGKYPRKLIQGYEMKDVGYLGSVLDYDEMPAVLRQQSIEPFAQTLAEHQCRNFCSWELRVTKDKKAYLIDPCMRCPSPGIDVELEIIDNLSQIVCAGAEGRLVEPEMNAKFGGQVAMTHDGPPDQWRAMKIPPDLRRSVHLLEHCKVGDVYWFPPRPAGNKVGWIVATADTMEEVAEKLKDISAELKNEPVKCELHAMADAIATVQKAEETRLFFADEKAPEPEVAMEWKE